MKALKLIAVVAAALALGGCNQPAQYDLCVYGGTSAGVVAAYSAAQQGLDVVLVEPTNHIGGMTTGGLGFTDIGNKQVISGVAKQFYRKVGAHYGRLEQWIFEPSVAEGIMRDYLRNDNIRVMEGYRIRESHKEGTRIAKIVVENSSKPSKTRTIKADYFIDCSYEGDLMARSGVEYTVGREANAQYGETYNGVELMTRHQFPDGIDPYKEKGNPESGLLWGISPAEVAEDGTADQMVQAYNYRICLTDDPANRIEITRPEDYDSTRYELLLRLMEVQPEKLSLNDYFIWSRMPNNKTDVNNRGGFSSDMIGMNHNYPEASYEERQEIIDAHTSYTKGLLYFIGHDERVPELLRERMQLWGYPKDEYTNNGNWTPQLYIREARRMVGEYVATQADCEGRTTVTDGVGMAAYQMDSHNCQRIVIEKNGKKMVKNEGNVEIGGGLPYPIAYRSITPKREQCTNLLVPVCLSASHIAYGSIRMEPVFMVLGQSAGVAAALAHKQGCCDIQLVDSNEINNVIAQDPYMDGSEPDILVDDADAGVVADDKWVAKGRGGYGLSFYELAPTTKPQSVRFTVDALPSAGEWAVYSYQSANKKLTSSTTFDILSGEKAHHITFLRDDLDVLGQTSGDWAHLGTFEFEEGAPVVVTISNATADATMRADAILLVKQ
ncbi:MAG: FAD-dependent oxidoreductase [Tidjanibacter sp.]|nr:FAD-dependent oxidoreductase [Tidjanibacter sp.]MBQ8272871.1 FAD-dependent oxidoreductase [Tidjanibacter sp.]